jgi:hypothetical protein
MCQRNRIASSKDNDRVGQFGAKLHYCRFQEMRPVPQPLDFGVFGRKTAIFQGLNFQTLVSILHNGRSVSAFRRSVLFATVTFAMILLGASPVTAPFSTYRFGGHAPNHLAITDKTESLKTDPSRLVVMDATDASLAMLLLPETLVRTSGPSSDTEPVRHAVLRV